MTQREDEMLPKLFQERGARTTADRAIRVLAGRCVGGSTVHNINLCKRTPSEILDLWSQHYSVSGARASDLEHAFASVERDLSVSEIPEDWRNANNRVLERGVQRLGWRGGPLRHNRIGCQKSGFCEIGCPFNAKQNALKVLIPDAVAHGARVVSDARVERVLHDGHRVQGVVGTLLNARGKPHAEFSVRAKAVVLCGGAIGSTLLSLVSGLPDPHEQLGAGFHLHPGAAVIGAFDEPVEGWKGVPQSYECTELLDLSPGSDKRVWITTAFAHPIGASVMLPGFGQAHRRWMLRYKYLAGLTAMVHDETSGRIRVASDGRPSLDYVLEPGDIQQLSRGLRACAEILLAAGAREVMIPSAPPIELKTRAELSAITADTARPYVMPMAAVHPLGGLRFGDDPKKASLKSTGEHHFVQGLFALDGSLFPTSIGVPPQISIYAFARHLTPHVARRLSS